MDTSDILRMRLRAQLVEGSSARSPRDVASRLLAVQAQDYPGALWAIGLRLPGSGVRDIESAIDERAIVRTWPMRGTLHFLAAEDVRWVLPLLAPRMIARAARREAQLSLDAATFTRARALFAAALTGGRRLTRLDSMAMLEGAGIATAGQRGYHILARLAQDGLLVLGPMLEKQQTFALLDEWVPAVPGRPDALPREEGLARLAARYFAGHGPATVDDLARWAAITKREASAALDAVAGTLDSAELDGVRYWFAADSAAPAAASADGVRLLPAFDEYMLGYKGRGHQLGEHLAAYGAKVASNGMLAPTVVIGGKAVGTWKRALSTRTVTIAVRPFRSLTTVEKRGVVRAGREYARFLGREASVEIA